MEPILQRDLPASSRIASAIARAAVTAGIDALA
jgi:hypothetical protein